MISISAALLFKGCIIIFASKCNIERATVNLATGTSSNKYGMFRGLPVVSTEVYSVAA